MKQIVLTFDDCSKGQYYNAFPVMKDLGFTASFYPVFHYTQPKDERFCDLDHLCELHESGFEIGNHTLSHHDLRKKDDELLTKEFVDMQSYIEKSIGTLPDTVVYPGFHYCDRVISFARRQFKFGRVGCNEEDFWGYQDGGIGEMYSPHRHDPMKVPCFAVIGRDCKADDMIEALEKAEDSEGSIPVLCFHEIGKVKEKKKCNLSISTKEFERCMEYLAKEKYKTIALKDLDRN